MHDVGKPHLGSSTDARRAASASPYRHARSRSDALHRTHADCSPWTPRPIYAAARSLPDASDLVGSKYYSRMRTPRSLVRPSFVLRGPTNCRFDGSGTVSATGGASRDRRLEAEGLDRLQAAIWEKACRGGFGCVDRVLRISQRRCALLGLDPPQHLAHINLSNLTDDQLLRIANGEPIASVLAAGRGEPDDGARSTKCATVPVGPATTIRACLPSFGVCANRHRRRRGSRYRMTPCEGSP